MPRALLPLVWVLAMLMLAGRAVGRGADRFLTAYLRGAATAHQVVVRTGERVVDALGPLGRALRRLLTPAVRALRQAWDEVGFRALRSVLRPLGRLGRRLLALASGILGRLAGPARTLLALAARLTRPLAPWWRGMVRASSRRAEQLRRGARTVYRAMSGAVRAARLMPGGWR